MEEGDLSHLKISELTDFEEINELAQHLRDELDDLKRSEVERIRKLLKGILRFMTSQRPFFCLQVCLPVLLAQNKLNEGKKVNIEALVNDVAGHIDPENIENFGLKDLNRLITSVASDMKDFDEKRHKKFKEYEMHKVFTHDNFSR